VIFEGGAGGVRSSGLAAAVVTSRGSLKADQFPSTSLARTVNR